MDGFPYTSGEIKSCIDNALKLVDYPEQAEGARGWALIAQAMIQYNALRILMKDTKKEVQND